MEREKKREGLCPFLSPWEASVYGEVLFFIAVTGKYLSQQGTTKSWIRLKSWIIANWPFRN